MIYFIRHGQSLYNKASNQQYEKYGEDFMKKEEYTIQQYADTYLDEELTEKGEVQAQEAKSKMAQIDIDLVIVSPMRRALHTADIIFKDHKSKPEVIIEPCFRQLFYGSADVGSKLPESVNIYPHFNYEKVKDKEAWFVYTLQEKDRENILKRIQGTEGKQRNQRAVEEVVSLMKECWPVGHDSFAELGPVIERLNTNLEEQLTILEEYLGKYKKIALVGHSFSLRRYTGYKLKNCQIFEISREKLPQKKQKATDF